MPQHQSSEKRVRQTERRNARNRKNKAEIKQLVKSVQRLTAAKASKEEVDQAFRKAVQKLDRMAVKGVLHRNNVARKKSSLASLVNTYATSTKA
ncbi:MAG: 30S ribosomal protein S20 [[Candidatus Thermochlorobacteriaceae] bacterium GBChlB]|nr:MAG: 30S ribosomal protein S20 [[Candidatus Thermochlorobacteriaceae] bacterium GBChlB]